MTAIEKAAAKVIALAESEIGYREKATNSQLDDKTANAGSNNYTKYGAYFDNQRGTYEYYNGKKNGFDWCDQFVDWLFAQCYGIDTGRRMLFQPMQSCGAGCAYSASYFRANSAWSTVPEPGDQIFFGPKGNESHTGIVAEVTEDRIITIEGNANNMVMKRSYSKGYSNITGYGRPNYKLVADQFKEPEKPAPKYLTEDEVIKLVDKHIEDICGKWIATINDVPHKSVKAIARELLDLEAVDGGTDYAVDPDDIRLPYNILRAIVIAKRYTDAVTKKTLPE